LPKGIWGKVVPFLGAKLLDRSASSAGTPYLQWQLPASSIQREKVISFPPFVYKNTMSRWANVFGFTNPPLLFAEKMKIKLHITFVFQFSIAFHQIQFYTNRRHCLFSPNLSLGLDPVEKHPFHMNYCRHDEAVKFWILIWLILKLLVLKQPDDSFSRPRPLKIYKTKTYETFLRPRLNSPITISVSVSEITNHWAVYTILA